MRVFGEILYTWLCLVGMFVFPMENAPFGEFIGNIYIYIIKYNITIYYITIYIYIYISFCGTPEANPRIDRSDRYLITRKLEYVQQTWELRQRCIWGGRLLWRSLVNITGTVVEALAFSETGCKGNIYYI